MHLKKIILGTLLGASCAVGLAQTSVPLELVWKVQADDPATSTPSTYMLTTSGNCRGMFLNPSASTGGSLLVASRDNGTAVRRIDPATGLIKSPAQLPSSSYLGSAFFPITKVVVSDDGIVYVCSLGLGGNANGEQHFRIYRHADESSEATISYDIRTDSISGVNLRLGDDMDITGTGNNTKILVVGSGGGLYQFTTADNGVTFTGQQITCSPALTGNPNLAWDPTTANRFFYRDATPNVTRAYDISGTTATGASGAGNVGPPAGTYQAFSPFDIGLVNGVHSFALGIGASAATTSNKALLIFRLSDLNVDYFGLGSEFQPGGAKANANASGDVYLDSTNNALYVLYTNNSVTKYRIPGASVGQWSNY